MASVSLNYSGDEQANEVLLYSLESGLPASAVRSRKTPSGMTMITSRLTDYKDSDGIKLANKIVQHIEAKDTPCEIRIDSFEINAT